MKRSKDRGFDELRPVKISYNVFGYADSSVLFEIGNTIVLCSVTLQQGVPHFQKGRRTGWLTAEYAMLPTATSLRKSRESVTGKRNGRSVEISRLISRSLRSVVDLKKIGEQTIIIDCDVLQADGGTRTASITGAYLALRAAMNDWVACGRIEENCITDAVAAISVGIKKGKAILDIDFSEDSSVDADYNFILTESGKIIEIQGTSEQGTISWELFDQARNLAIVGIKKLLVYGNQKIKINPTKKKFKKRARSPLFSLQNRQKTAS